MVNAAQQVQKIAGREFMLPLPPAPLDDEDDEQDLLGEFYPDALETTVVDTQGKPVASPAAPSSAASAESATGKPDAATAPVEKSDAEKAPAADKVAPPADKTATADTHPATIGKPAADAAKTPMPKDDPLRARIAEDLTVLAELRGTAKRDMKEARKELLAEITTDLCGDPIPFAALAVAQGVRVAQELSVRIAARQAKSDAPVDDAVPPPSDDDIPE